MMSIRVSGLHCTLRVLILFCAALLGMVAPGCQSTKKPPPEAGMSNPEKVAAMRESIQKSQPGAQVGQVILTLPDKPFTAVGDMPVQDLKIGQTLTFVDIEGNPVNNGKIVQIYSDHVDIKFDGAGKRRPQKGDLAVWLKE